MSSPGGCGGRGGGDHSTCALVSSRDNVVLKGVIMPLLACAPVITAGLDLECCHGRIRRGSRGHGPRLMEAKQPPAPAPAVQKSAFRGKTRATSERSRNTIRQYERQFNPLI